MWIINYITINIMTNNDLKNRLTDIQYYVTQESGTERPFDNEYWNHEDDGIYVDIVDGTPLFTSKDKFDSGCGWPSFSKPVTDDKLTEHSDTKLARERVEVRSENADSHLGHVFPDGPKELWGLRYCINSAALRFVSYDDLDDEGYGEYKKIFE